jgi:hypothetical protein
MATATPSRISRCSRDYSYATASNPAVLAARPDAKPQGGDEFTIDSFFDNVADAQVMLDEKFAVLASSRRNEAAETAVPLRVGTDIAIAPVLPKARMIDANRGVDAVLIIKGLSVDTHTERNSIEAVG